MKVLYFDCFAGISGDMVLGAMIDLGIDQQQLVSELEKLNVKGYELHFSKKKKNGIEGTDVDVVLHTHDDHNHQHDHGHHHHRDLQSIEKIIDESTLDENVKALSKNIFMKVAEAEAKIHGISVDKVHFHEVGAIDSIVDIVGTAICIHMLEVEHIMSSPLHEGTGFVKCQHGLIPIPAPATLEILRASATPFYSTGIPKELVTPTGAAVIATLAQEFGNMPPMIVEKIGYGTGKRDMEIPNVLRVCVGEIKKKQDTWMK